MKCPTCEKGKMKIVAQIYNPETHTFDPQDPVYIDCINCNGTGELTPAQTAHLEALDNAWCKCGNPSGNVIPYRYSNGAHGYDCADCGKLIQTG